MVNRGAPIGVERARTRPAGSGARGTILHVQRTAPASLRGGVPGARLQLWTQDVYNRLAHALMPSREHDVFVSFAKSAGDFRVRGSLSGYLATSVVNRVRDHKRRLRRQARRDAAFRVSNESPEPDQRVIFTEQADRLNQAVAQLPDEQREIVLLRLTAGMKFRDIAKSQRISTNTAQGRYRYGLDKLRSLLNGEVKE